MLHGIKKPCNSGYVFDEREICGLNCASAILPEREREREERIMAKGQQKSNKETKKPKKDTSAPKPPSAEPVRATVTTTVIPRGKLKNKV